MSHSSLAVSEAKTVEITVAIVEYRTMMHTLRRGVCTAFLSERSIGQKLRVFCSKGVMKLPPQDVPIIMVGPGTLREGKVEGKVEEKG